MKKCLEKWLFFNFPDPVEHNLNWKRRKNGFWHSLIIRNLLQKFEVQKVDFEWY